MFEITQVNIKSVNFKKLLERANLNITDISKLSGVSKQMIHNVIRGKQRMTEETWSKITPHLPTAPKFHKKSILK